MQITLIDRGDLKAVNKALKHAEDGKRLRKELVAELKEVARPLVPKVQAAWLAAPAHQGRARAGRPDLRRLLADSTWVQVRLTGKAVGVNIRSDGRKMPNRMKALPGYAEGIRRRGWRHPTFGNREKWIDQRPFPRFYAAVQPDQARARQACSIAVGRVFDQIRRAT
jgi:hypothetical protein